MYDGYTGHDPETDRRTGGHGKTVVVAMAAVAVLATAGMVVVGLRDTPSAQSDAGVDGARNAGSSAGGGIGRSTSGGGFNPAAAHGREQRSDHENVAARESDAKNDVFLSPGERGYEKESHELKRINGAKEPPPGGVKGEPGGYDPLGKDARGDEVTETQRERARLAAARFVVAAYGYSGDDANQYAQGVAGCVTWPEFYSSPGGKQIKEYIEDVRKGGVKSAAKLERFEVERGNAGEVVAVAYYATARGYTRYGELEGKKRYYRQELTLVPDGSQYEVRAASAVKELGG